MHFEQRTTLDRERGSDMSLNILGQAVLPAIHPLPSRTCHN